jgi:hypothetical protein
MKITKEELSKESSPGQDVSSRSVTLTQNQIWFILRAVEGYRDEILYDLSGVRPTPEQQEEINALGRI